MFAQDVFGHPQGGSGWALDGQHPQAGLGDTSFGPNMSGNLGVQGNFGNFTHEEQENYHRLWLLVDPQNHGHIDGNTAASFLSTSNLPQDVLHQIWEISAQQQGALTLERFFVACRLVAHAQANQPLSPAMEGHVPGMLPEFHNVPTDRQRAPSETSNHPHAPPLTGSPANSDHHDLQPVISGGDLSTQHAARAQRRAAQGIKPFMQEQWAPSRRQLRKYAALFQRNDWDHDGLIQGHEALELLQRSGLTHDQLGVLWELADQDRDGRLDFKEFVCLVHLVTCCLRGAPAPGQHDPLPEGLQRSLAMLDSAEVLAAEREASRSRSASPGPSVRATPTMEAATPFGGSPGLDDPWGGPTGALGGDAGLGGVFGEPDRFGAATDATWEAQAKTKKGKKSKKDKDFAADLGGISDPFGTDGAKRGEGGDHFGDPFGAATTGTGFEATDRREGTGGRRRNAMDFDEIFQHHADRTFKEDPLPDRDTLASQFQTVTAVDGELSKTLRREVDELHQEMQVITDDRARLQREIQQEQADELRLTGKRASLNSQLEDGRSKLAVLREEKRKLNAESLSLRQDHARVAEDLRRLVGMVADEEQTVEVLRRANKHLEMSFQTLEQHGEGMQRQLKGLTAELQLERDRKRLEEEGLADLRRTIDQLRRGGSLTSGVALADAVKASVNNPFPSPGAQAGLVKAALPAVQPAAVKGAPPVAEALGRTSRTQGAAATRAAHDGREGV